MTENTRARLELVPGNYVTRGDSTYRIEEVLDFRNVFAREVESGAGITLAISEVAPLNPPPASSELSQVSDPDWREALHRFDVIKPLLASPRPGRDAVEDRAKGYGYSVSTLYRWIGRYRRDGVLTALIPSKRGWRAGKSRLEPQADRIIGNVVEDVYLTVQRPSAANAAREITRRCREQGISPPSKRTIYSRINAISERDSLRRRGFREAAKNRFTPAPGHFPNADYPLSVVQIDHTPADIILVDDQHRRPIGRPWITIALDVTTRMITGYHLSFDAPSEASVALCMANSVNPKDQWLAEMGVEGDWPVWGMPDTVHVDNGADFRSDNLARACQQYGINLEFRPAGAPRYGGHVERVLGTINDETQQLPGTTFSSVADRAEYVSDKHSVLTKSEYERWLVTFICNVYHQKKHSGLGISPIKQWELGVFGDGEKPGIGLPPRPVDPARILLDFMPRYERTVQIAGVTIENLSYYDPALRPWVNARDEKGLKRKLTFRRDPRDISAIWFFDPDLKEYFRVPCADQAMPALSAWEFKEAKKRLHGQGYTDINEVLIHRALTEMRDQVDQAAKQTKTARRSAQRRSEHKKATARMPNDSISTAGNKGAGMEVIEDDWAEAEDIGGWGDIG